MPILQRSKSLGCLNTIPVSHSLYDDVQQLINDCVNSIVNACINFRSVCKPESQIMHGRRLGASCADY